MLKKISTMARHDMEKFMGTKVFLETWVKVKENWRENANYVRSFGYDERQYTFPQIFRRCRAILISEVMASDCRIGMETVLRHRRSNTLSAVSLPDRGRRKRLKR